MSITTDKKTNVEYWDRIDALAERHVKDAIELSTTPLAIPGTMTMDDVALDVSKMLTEPLVNCLEQLYGASFPYVEGNY